MLFLFRMPAQSILSVVLEDNNCRSIEDNAVDRRMSTIDELVHENKSS